jgi:prolyl oligopeptidase
MGRTFLVVVTGLTVSLGACSIKGVDRPESPPAVAAAPAPAADAAPAPPTRREEIVEVMHGTKVADPYRWLEEASSDEVQAWMTSQDAVAREYLASRPGRERLTARMRELVYVDTISPPYRRGDRYFFSRQARDKEKGIQYVRRGVDGPEEVLIDPNELSKDGSVSLLGLTPSHTGRYVAYKLSVNNADTSTMYVRDLETGKDSEIDVIEGARYARASWTPDDKGFYYVALPVDPDIPVDQMPGHAHIRYHRLGTAPATDEIIEPATGDPTKFLGVGVSLDGHWLLKYVTRGEYDEVYVRDRRKKSKTWTALATGFDATYGVDIYRDQFYVTTNAGAPNRRVYKVDPRRLDRKHWREIVAERDYLLESATVVGKHLVLDYLRDAYSSLEIHDLDGKLVREVKLPGIGSTSGLIGQEDDDEAYYYYASYTAPPQIFQMSVATGATKLWNATKYPVDPSRFEARQVKFPSKDGTTVSMFIVHEKGIALDGSNPTLLYGYGGFGVNMTPWFSTYAVAWAELGGVYAVVNLRGGGEYGEDWHRAGMRGDKQNVFDDFIAASEYLVSERYTRPDKLAISGGSNGGLLVGAAMTQRPDLYGAVICSVPLLDMVRFTEFGSGRTWIPEYGDPQVAEEFAWLHAYSPYHHVKPSTAYPALLMESADSDDRVDPMHARKFVAAIQNSSTSGEPALLRIERNAGHGGADLRAKRVEENVDEFVFLLDELHVSTE